MPERGVFAIQSLRIEGGSDALSMTVMRRGCIARRGHLLCIDGHYSYGFAHTERPPRLK